MTGPDRLRDGGLIDRTKPVTFTWNGRVLGGYEGDTLASALLANGVHLVARSFKYRRPRGILGHGTEEPNAMVQTGDGNRTEPNPKATVVPLVEGLRAKSVNTAKGGPESDPRAGMGMLSRFMPAGFYYKMFHGSQTMWQRVWEPIIRQAAGWGTCPTEPDPDTYDHMNLHCDVLVVGGGPAGIAAAREAAKSGARVVLADEQERFGGRLLDRPRNLDGLPGHGWADREVAALAEEAEVTLLPRTTVFGYYDHNLLCALERRTDHLAEAPSHVTRQRLWHIRARRVVLATGAHERPLVFADNDRPGIMLASAVAAYVHRWAVLPGREAVVFTNNDGAWEAAHLLKKAGAPAVTIIDSRPKVSDALKRDAEQAGITVKTGHAVTGTRGGKRVTAALVQPVNADGTRVNGPAQTLACDLIATSGGWSPVVHLFSQSRGTLTYDDTWACFRPGVAVQPQASVGACNGTFGLAETLAEAAEAGVEAARAAGFETAAPAPAPSVEAPEATPPVPLWLVPADTAPGRGGKWFVDFQNDTTAADILLAVREGFESVEHVKRYTLAGFGTDQGKTANINALAILAGTLGRPIPEVGTTTFRAPYTPVTFGAMAGRNLGDRLEPQRLTNIHDRHVALRAAFEDVGQWKRPWYYPKAGEDMHAAVARECKATRDSVGVLDASTLGKIDIQGPDAAEFLNRVYTNAWTKLAVGRVRYGIMCGEDGMVFDDGTTARIDENRYLMTTTTGGAAHVMDHLEEYLQTEWPDLRVRLTSVTEQWATVAVAGPKALEVVKRVCPDDAMAPADFPFLSWKTATAAGIPARIFRISFTGELQYEINVPWHHGADLWDAVMEAGKDFDITPYGTETMHVLRAEKGFIITGQETDGTQTPFDLGMDWIVSKKKPDFIGRRSLFRPDMQRPDRKQLVGLKPEDPKVVLPEGTQIVEPGALNRPPPVPMLGFVTSSYHSPALESGFALALIAGGRDRLGETVEAALPSGPVTVRLHDPVFYDAEGARRDG
ncbi:Sarcosine oxidase alpha subunit [Caenispirillum salinarum AK4]|uniref:Sarcosine oxidase alpha subunit n=1 Tax=Caenispirillum salinarum AK4 TaxID=1238182 RepID=K9H8V6_9PROT|nr:sarcosine oxidase subunit alpha family protein [Caenispirillum salinarum]EKV27033.1 Sarcosine oxidase alpha subunit [Caenispirillum salinarum AK4]